jgi:hypothetical protein
MILAALLDLAVEPNERQRMQGGTRSILCANIANIAKIVKIGEVGHLPSLPSTRAVDKSRTGRWLLLTPSRAENETAGIEGD